MDIAVGGELIGKLVILLVVYLVWRMNGNLLGVMLAYVIGCFINLVVNLSMTSKFVKTGLAFDKKYWCFVIRQAIPIGVTLIFGYVYFKVDSLMLSLLKGMTDVGIYSAPYKLLEVLQIFPALFLGSSFSLITRYINEKDDRISPAFQKQFDFLTFLVMPIVIGTFILAMPIIKFITGSDGRFIEASTVTIAGHAMTSVNCLRILIFSVAISFFSTLYNFLIVSLGKQKQMLWPTICFAIFNISLNFYLIPRYSYIGAAVATVLTEAIVLWTAHHVVKRNIKVVVQFSDFFKILLSALVMGAVCYWVYYYSGALFVSLFASVAVYAIMVIALGVIPKGLIEKGFKGIKI
jgi:O-antigen/teichoic acid export membrane protein